MPSVFVYPQIQSPYVGSIADIMLRKGDIAAQAARDIGQIQGQAQQQVGQAWAGATNQIGQAIAQPLEQMADPRRQLAQQQVDENKRALAYQTTASKIAQSLVGPNGEQPTPDQAQALMTAAGIPIEHQKAVTDSLTAVQNRHKENYADLAHLVYRTVKALPDTASLEDRNQAASGALGAAQAFGAGISKEDLAHVTTALAQGQDPLALSLGFMGASPSGRYKEIVQDETKPISAGRNGVWIPNKGIVGAPQTPTKYEQKTVNLGGKQFLVNYDPATGKSFDPKTGEDISGVISPSSPPKSLQSKSVLVDGKPAEVSYDPATGTHLDDAGNKIDGSRIKPIPPASIQIHNENAKALDLPTWATDDSRPTGADANRPHPTLQMTPNGLYQAAVTYIATGQLPQTGRGSSDPTVRAQREAVQSKVGAIAASAGMDVPQLRSFFKANSASLIQEQKQYDAAQANITTADRNVAQLEPLLSKLPDIGSPLFNKPLREFMKSVVGDPIMGPIGTYLASVQNEYGKIINSSNGGAVLTDSARQEAQQLIADNATVKQMLGSIQALKTEGGNRLQSIGDQIQRIQSRMTVGQPGGGGNVSVPDAVTQTLKGQKAGRYTLSDGSVWTVNASGGISPAK